MEYSFDRSQQRIWSHSHACSLHGAVGLDEEVQISLQAGTMKLPDRARGPLTLLSGIPRFGDFSRSSNSLREALLMAAERNAFPLFFSFVLKFHDQVPGLTGQIYDALLRQKGLTAESAAAMRAAQQRWCLLGFAAHCRKPAPKP